MPASIQLERYSLPACDCVAAPFAAAVVTGAAAVLAEGLVAAPFEELVAALAAAFMAAMVGTLATGIGAERPDADPASHKYKLVHALHQSFYC